MDPRALTQSHNKEFTYNPSPSIPDDTQFGTPHTDNIHVVNF